VIAKQSREGWFQSRDTAELLLRCPPGFSHPSCPGGAIGYPPVSFTL